MSLAGLVDLTALPQVTGGVEAAVALRLGALQVRARGRYLAPAVFFATTQPPIGSRFQLAAAALEGCGLPVRTRPIAVALCAVNVFGGFLVTRRMLEMFKKKDKKAPAAGAKE